MKHRTILLLAAAVLLSPSAAAQQKLNTKKLKIAGLESSTAKVVLSGNDIMDSALKEEVGRRWRISPFEFCTVADFNTLKEDPDCYFLLIAGSDERKFRGMKTLTFMKGGPVRSDDLQKKCIDVASIPFCSAGFSSGRELAMLPAFLDIMQDYLSKALKSDKAAYAGFDIYSSDIRASKGSNIFLLDEDCFPELDEKTLHKMQRNGISITDETETDLAFNDDGTENLVSYVVFPQDPDSGSLCYKMLIGSQSHSLYYFKHHRLKEGKWAGFLPKDIKNLIRAR